MIQIEQTSGGFNDFNCNGTMMIDIDKPLELGMLPPSFAFGQIHILPISTMILQ